MIRICYAAIVAILLVFCALAAFAQTATGSPARPVGTPMVTSSTTTTATARVTAVDYANRTVTLATPSGATRTYKVGSDVRNLNQVKPGDMLTAAETEKVSIFAQRGGARPSYSETSSFERAARGAKPGFVATNSATIVGKVQNVNYSARTVTIAGPNQTRTFTVGPNVRNLTSIKPGDNVVVQYSDSVSLQAQGPAGR